MGGLFKSKKTTTTEKTESKQEQQNWLAKNPEYVSLVNSAISEASNYNLPDYELAGPTAAQNQQLAALTKGVDLSSYQNAANYLQGLGKNDITQGQKNVSQYNNILSNIGGMTQADYSNAIQNEINGAITGNRIRDLQTNINEQTGTAINALNKQAGGSGNMGNSRAGVAQGIIQGKAAQALTQGITTIQGEEETAAANRVQSYLTNKYNAATAGLTAAQNQQQFGYNAFNQGQTYNSQFNAGYLQNIQNALTAQEQVRGYQQQQLDVNRMNQLQRMSPALNRLMYANQGLAPIANFSTSGTSSGTTTTTQSSSGGLGQSLMGMAGAAAGAYFSGGLGLTAAQGMGLGGMFGGMIGSGMSR